VEGERVLPDTNQNYYELAWKAREVIVDQIISKYGNSLKSVLDQFSLFEGSHEVDVQKGVLLVEGTEDKIPVLTGRVQFIKAPDISHKEIEEHIASVNRRMEFLATFLEDDVEVVVELGCGYGLNLFRLKEILGDRTLRYIGAEYTESGRRLCAKLADIDGEMPVEVDFIDHKSPNLDFLNNIGKCLIFTCHSIEQVEEIPSNYFSILAKAAEKIRCVHFEPFGFQVPDFSHKFLQQKQLFENKGWNKNFFEILRAAEKNGEIQIDRIEVEMFVDQPGNPTSVAVWDNA
jgi:hypothetical protein